MAYSRLALLFGEDTLALLQQKNVLLLGVGGVGSFCLDCLYRSGIQSITIVDFDTYDLSNQNRQMWSELHENESKVQSLKKHYPKVDTIEQRIDRAWIEAFDFSSFDIILDAIDDTQAKIALAIKCHEKLISSMGSAKRVDPTMIECKSLWKTEGDPFARKIRYELRKRKFKGDYQVICSKEEPKCIDKGSFVGVTGAFGLTLCSKAIELLLQEKRNETV